MHFQLGFISLSVQEDAALVSWPIGILIRIRCFICPLRVRLIQF